MNRIKHTISAIALFVMFFSKLLPQIDGLDNSGSAALWITLATIYLLIAEDNRESVGKLL